MAESKKTVITLAALVKPLANPIVILFLAIAFLLGNMSRPINFKGCNSSVDSSSVNGIILSPDSINGQAINDSALLEKSIQHRRDSLKALKK